MPKYHLPFHKELLYLNPLPSAKLYRFHTMLQKCDELLSVYLFSRGEMRFLAKTNILISPDCDLHYPELVLTKAADSSYPDNNPRQIRFLPNDDEGGNLYHHLHQPDF